MTLEEVKATFPKAMQWQDEPINEVKQYCWMQRCYSTNSVTRRLSFQEVKMPRVAQVYFDSDGKLVGIYTFGTGDISLKTDELRFPGELRMPKKWGNDAAYPEQYRQAIFSSATDRP
jgi:hypothetical protein